MWLRVLLCLACATLSLPAWCADVLISARPDWVVDAAPGVPTPAELKQASDGEVYTLADIQIRAAAESRVRALTASLESTDFFPKMFLQAVQVGTEFGDLSRALRQNAHLLELELEYRLQMVEQMLEPLVMLVMGMVVGFTVIATMLPLLQVAESL